MDGLDNINNELNQNYFSQSLQNWNIKKYMPNPINLPKAGIPKEDLINSNNSLFSKLECPICLNLAWNPVECNRCGNIFCQFCINEMINRRENKCPTCRTTTPFIFRKAIAIKKFFNEIRIKCPYKNCKKCPQYSDYVSHLEKCDFRLYHCTNEGCNYQDILVNVQYHSNECQYRIIKCQYCQKDIKQNNLETHEKTECSQEVECQKCFSVMERGFFWTNHYSENDDNIECLKAQISKLEKDSQKLKENITKINDSHKKEVDKYKNTILNLEEKNKSYKNENLKLTKKLEDFNKSFKDIYNRLILNNGSEQNRERYHTLENEARRLSHNNNYIIKIPNSNPFK